MKRLLFRLVVVAGLLAMAAFWFPPGEEQTTAQGFTCTVEDVCENDCYIQDPWFPGPVPEFDHHWKLFKCCGASGNCTEWKMDTGRCWGP